MKTCFFLLYCLFQSQGRESIAAKLVANMITEAGANRVLVCDLHSSQAMGYFDIPVDHVYGQVLTDACSFS
jgi:ribose-phosphate pyrophosphokinase